VQLGDSEGDAKYSTKQVCSMSVCEVDRITPSGTPTTGTCPDTSTCESSESLTSLKSLDEMTTSSPADHDATLVIDPSPEISTPDEEVRLELFDPDSGCYNGADDTAWYTTYPFTCGPMGRYICRAIREARRGGRRLRHPVVVLPLRDARLFKIGLYTYYTI
jgi:hypothetical protein